MANQMTSSEFRRAYPGLTETTIVTALGRTIGIWHPAVAGSYDRQGTTTMEAERRGFARPTAQAERDAILRRVNRSG